MNQPENVVPQEQRKASQQVKNQDDDQGQVKVTFYTDPLCCWSWAFESSWRKLLELYGDRIQCSYVMCGMIRDWTSYNDPMNAVTKPLQMGPVWMHASETTHVKMDYAIWHRDPPFSSYPPCIAVKTAALQSGDNEKLFLDAIRKACFEDGQNISNQEVILEVAKSLSSPTFSFEQFESDWLQGNGKELFRMDLQRVRFYNIGRYPTLTFERPGSQGSMIVGYRPYDVLAEVFERIL